jgi:hypothetical protein
MTEPTTTTSATARIRHAVRKPPISIRASSSAGLDANAKLITAFDVEVTSPRRLSNHCDTIVRDVNVSRPCPVNRSAPKPMLITAMPTTVDIGPTVLSPTSVMARPTTATTATRRDPY